VLVPNDTPWASLTAFWREARRTSFGRLMVAGICDGMALLVVAGLRHPSIPGAIAAMVLVPLAVVASWSWWTNRPAKTGALPERAVTGYWMRGATAVLLFFVGALVLLGVVGLLQWLAQ